MSLEATNRLTDTFELIGRTLVDVFQGQNWNTLDRKVGLTNILKKTALILPLKREEWQGFKKKTKLDGLLLFIPV